MAKPVDTISVPTGKGSYLNAAIWENEVDQEGRRYTTYSVTLEKRYREGDAWKTAKSFQAHEMLQVAYLATEAYKKTQQRRQDTDRQQVA